MIQTSFQNVSTWLKGLDRYGGSDVTMILVGNKSDLNSKRVVEYSMGKVRYNNIVTCVYEVSLFRSKIYRLRNEWQQLAMLI